MNATITVNPVADTPSVTNATTNEDTQTTSGLVISRNAADGAEVTHFKITGITNGTLYKNDGTTQITNGTFITFAEGNAGLKFTPTANFNGSGSFTVQASTSNGDAGLGGSTVVATITVNAGQRRAGAGQHEEPGAVSHSTRCRRTVRRRGNAGLELGGLRFARGAGG